jgi:hypothetical protein
MRKLILTLVILSLPICLLAKDRILDCGSLAKNKNLQPAIYRILKDKGVSCFGMTTKADGTVVVKNASADKPEITSSEIDAALKAIDAENDAEVLIQTEIRALAISNLKKNGKIPANYKDKGK